MSETKEISPLLGLGRLPSRAAIRSARLRSAPSLDESRVFDRHRPVAANVALPWIEQDRNSASTHYQRPLPFEPDARRPYPMSAGGRGTILELLSGTCKLLCAPAINVFVPVIVRSPNAEHDRHQASAPSPVLPTTLAPVVRLLSPFGSSVRRSNPSKARASLGAKKWPTAIGGPVNSHRVGALTPCQQVGGRPSLEFPSGTCRLLFPAPMCLS
jgi:hypothetical protein